MPFSSGDKLGPYEIVEPIGKGGMGAVYRARDTRLGRDVAIKVSDQKFGERFEREARVISSLNHPNICTLFDVGDNYLVMELVEGSTLAERIKSGAIPLEESLAIARQIADALEAAHEKGITHRDLKPGNVMVKEDGTVKVLDFGLAKVASVTPASGSDPELSPTISMHATQAGVILGTAAYMAPEQARGKPVDKRADIWAFGVMLYEMVTGKRLFQGEDLTDTLASVVKIDPDLSAAPLELRPLLEKCLQKDPRNRLRDISAVDAFLEVGRKEAALAASQRQAHPTSEGGRKWIWPTVAAIAIVVAAGSFLFSSDPEAEDRPLVRLTADLGDDIDLGPPGNAGATISPDGTRLAYVASVAGRPGQLYTRRLDQTVATALPGTEGAAFPFFSPDGEWIGFSQRSEIKKISVEGGAAVSLGMTETFTGASWGEDGTIVFGTALTGGLLRIPEAGGEPELLAPLAGGEFGNDAPRILPGGRAVLFTAMRAPGAGQQDVAVFTLADGQRKILVPGASSGAYLPTGGSAPGESARGHLIYLSGGTLFAVRFDPERLETSGAAIPVLDGVGSAASGSATLGFSRDGAFVYRSGGYAPPVGRRTVEWLDASGKREPLIGTPGGYCCLRLSPDARRLALGTDQGVSRGISVYDRERGGFGPLTFDPGGYNYPVWSPDGRFVVFMKQGTLLWARADGAEQPQPLLEGAAIREPFSFTPDGSRLAYSELGNNRDVWTVPVTTEGAQLKAGEPERFLATQFAESDPMFSPDGRWIAYMSNESGRPEISVRAFPPPKSAEGAKFPVSTDGGQQPVWSRNTAEMFFQSPDGKIMVAGYRVNGDTFVADRPRVWAELAGDLQGATFYDMGPDGRALITVRAPSGAPGEPEAAPAPRHTIGFLLNFFDELRRRVPGNGK